MQEIQLILAQAQTVLVQLAFQVVAVLGLGLAWLMVAIGTESPHVKVWRELFGRVARTTLVLGLVWLVVLATAWPPLLERVGNVLGPVLGAAVAVVLVVESLVARAMRAQAAWLRSAATVLTAMGYTVALALVVVAESWMREPVGAALIDGRFLVIDWQELLTNEVFAQTLLATLLGALMLLAALLQLANQPKNGLSLTLPGAWRRALTALGLASSVGLLWLVSSSVGANSMGAFYDSVLQASDGAQAGAMGPVSAWLMRVLLVLWIVTVAGLVVSLAGTAGSSNLARIMSRVPLVSAPLMWCLTWWQLNAQAQASLVSGLPVADLVSGEPTVVLVAGLLLVSAVVVASFVVLWRGSRKPVADANHEEALVQEAAS